jgi:hypothetical protein
MQLEGMSILDRHRLIAYKDEKRKKVSNTCNVMYEIEQEKKYFLKIFHLTVSMYRFMLLFLSSNLMLIRSEWRQSSFF